MERQLNNMLKSKNYIDNGQRDNKLNFINFGLLFMTLMFIETMVYMLIRHYYNFNSTNYLNDLIYFIPLSFVYEIIFDFFHYTAHRLEHNNKYLYQYVHKIHHTHSHPTTLTTYYQHPLDIIMSKAIPNIITLCIVSRISTLTLDMILTYKTFVEIGGHLRK